MRAAPTVPTAFGFSLAALLLAAAALALGGCSATEPEVPAADPPAEFSEAPPPPPLSMPAAGFSFESPKQPGTCGADGDASCDAPAGAQTGAAKAIAEVPEPDRSCQVDADCAVKDIGNCCGYYPACVNAQAETFPERVKAACEAQGLSSICGFEDISACACVDGRCAAAPGGAELL